MPPENLQIWYQILAVENEIAGELENNVWQKIFPYIYSAVKPTSTRRGL